MSAELITFAIVVILAAIVFPTLAYFSPTNFED